jgi:hypothetical protein
MSLKKKGYNNNNSCTIKKYGKVFVESGISGIKRHIYSGRQNYPTSEQNIFVLLISRKPS